MKISICLLLLLSIFIVSCENESNPEYTDAQGEPCQDPCWGAKVDSTNIQSADTLLVK